MDAPKRMAVQALMQEPCATDHDLSALLEAKDAALGFQAVYAVRQRGANGVVKRSNPEKNPRRYPEQKREKEWSTEESRIYRPLV